MADCGAEEAEFLKYMPKAAKAAIDLVGNKIDEAEAAYGSVPDDPFLRMGLANLNVTRGLLTLNPEVMRRAQDDTLAAVEMYRAVRARKGFLGVGGTSLDRMTLVQTHAEMSVAILSLMRTFLSFTEHQNFSGAIRLGLNFREMTRAVTRLDALLNERGFVDGFKREPGKYDVVIGCGVKAVVGSMNAFCSLLPPSAGRLLGIF